MPYMQVFAHFFKKNEVFVVKNLEMINLFLVLSFLSG